MSLLILPAVAGATSVQQTPPFDVGQTVNADPDNSGELIQWFTCDATTGSLGASLATNSDGSYTIQETDVGTDICAQDTVTMTSSGPQGPIDDPGATPPTISTTGTGGTATLTATDGHWTQPPTDGIQTQWVDCPSATSVPTSCPVIPAKSARPTNPRARTSAR